MYVIVLIKSTIIQLIYFMAEEKIRNYKTTIMEPPGSESIPSFLLKTYEILEVLLNQWQNSKYSDIICWTKNGEGFVVKKVKQFAQNILPTHFRHSNYTSFVRQLNMYDFHKTRQQNQENAFKNSMFKRGQRHLLKQIERKDYKKKKQKPESTEKMSSIINQIDAKQAKKIQHEKQFYMKGLNILEKIDDEMSLQQQKLAKIDDVDSSDQSISQILDLMFHIKSLNISWFNTLNSMGKQWNNMLNIKRNMLREEMESGGGQKKREEGPTSLSLNELTQQ